MTCGCCLTACLDSGLVFLGEVRLALLLEARAGIVGLFFSYSRSLLPL